VLGHHAFLAELRLEHAYADYQEYGQQGDDADDEPRPFLGRQGQESEEFCQGLKPPYSQGLTITSILPSLGAVAATKSGVQPLLSFIG
jgi:hypothetical protein